MLETFANDLNRALKNSSPRKHPYSAVHVLLLRWVDDDLNVQSELASLGAVFRHQFNFVVVRT